MEKHKNYEVWKGYIVPGFSDIMINQLAKHGDRGDNWKDTNSYWLLNRARDELKEVEDALSKIVMASPSQKEIDSLARECADVANFMMMIADSVDSI